MVKIWRVLVAFAIAVAIFLACLALYYASQYFIDHDNTHRLEYLAGSWIATLISIPFWIFTSISIYLNKVRLPKMLSIVIHLLTIAVCLAFIASVSAPLYFDTVVSN